MTYLSLLRINSIGSIGGGVILLLLILYFLPSIIAMVKSKSNTAAILVLNLFLGWTIIGWIVALVWAVSANNIRNQPIIVNNSVQQTDSRSNAVETKPSGGHAIHESKVAVIKPGNFSQQDKINHLRELKQLLDDGILTQDEFNQQKAQVLTS